MSAAEILKELKANGSESYKRTMMRHGAKEPIFGVSIEYMKKIVKREKKNYQLSLDLYDTGVSDAMYLAGLLADDKKMTKKDLKKWMAGAYWAMVSEYTVPWVAAESDHGWEMAQEWIESKKENVASAGWQTISSLVAIKDDEELDVPAIKKLLQRVQKTIHEQPNRVKYVMNNFVIATAAGVKELTEFATEVAKKIGKVEVDMGDTSCKTPDAVEYIEKIRKRGSIGKKRKTCKC